MPARPATAAVVPSQEEHRGGGDPQGERQPDPLRLRLLMPATSAPTMASTTPHEPPEHTGPGAPVCGAHTGVPGGARNPRIIRSAPRPALTDPGATRS